jgi:hypothetical protein
MILSNSSSLSTPFNFLTEHYGHHKLSFHQLQNGSLEFFYEDSNIYISAEVGADSLIYMSPQITFNTPDINWRLIEVVTNGIDNYGVTIESWVAKGYKWS